MTRKWIITFILVSQFSLVQATNLKWEHAPTKKLGWGHEVPLELLIKMLPENPIILEAGAHYAQDTHWMAHTWPKGIIHAFEPTPVNYKRVELVAKKHSNIKCYTYALDFESGIKSFYQDGCEDWGNQGANSLLEHKLLKKSSQEPFDVECITIDEWAKKYGIDHIDFMWIDIEGNELNALKGALKMLPMVKAIFVEVNFKELWDGCCLYPELKSWLEEQGFEEVWKCIKDTGFNRNVLFLKKEL